jgi:tRNA threonylcarbamoyladenosine biosynthesis protein TsaB
MNMLVIEMSTAQASLALFREQECIAERAWHQKEEPGQHLWTLLPELLAEANASPESLDLLACGRGPGGYASLRIGLTAAQGLALPGGRELYTVSSGEALARAEARRHEPDTFEMAIVGDARRESVWIGRFTARDGRVDPESSWEVLPLDQLASGLPVRGRVFSPDWSTLRDRLPREATEVASWTPEDRFPRARDVGRAVLDRRESRIVSEPAVPLYLHPAVRPASR